MALVFHFRFPTPRFSTARDFDEWLISKGHTVSYGNTDGHMCFVDGRAVKGGNLELKIYTALFDEFNQQRPLNIEVKV